MLASFHPASAGRTAAPWIRATEPDDDAKNAGGRFAPSPRAALCLCPASLLASSSEIGGRRSPDGGRRRRGGGGRAGGKTARRRRRMALHLHGTGG